MEIVSLESVEWPQLIELEHSVHAEPWSAESLLDALSRYRGWGLKHQGQLVAASFWQAAVDEWHLLSLGVKLEFQRQQWGYRLLSYGLEQGVEAQLAVALLEVRRSNLAAIRLYQRCGFEAIAQRRRYYRDGEDALIFQLDLRGR